MRCGADVLAGWGLAALAALLCLVAARPVRAGEPIRIALPAPYTGNLAAGGDAVKAGAVMKVDEINAAGGIAGRKVEAVPFDELCEPREAASVALRIATDPAIVGVVGHLCSSAHLAALPTYVREGMPIVSPAATSVVISSRSRDEDGRVWAFRTVYRDDYQGKFLAKYMHKVLGLRRVAVLYENSDYGIGLKKAFLKQAHRRGLAVVGLESFKHGDLDFTPQLTTLRSTGPEGLFIAGYYAEAALIVDQARKIGLTVPAFGADGLDNPDYIRLAGPAAEGTYCTTPLLGDAPGSSDKAFREAFRARYRRDPDWMSAHGYDAAGVLLAAVAAAGPDRDRVRAALAGMTGPEKGYPGVTGTIFFNASGDCPRPAAVKLVRDGAFVPAPEQME